MTLRELYLRNRRRHASRMALRCGERSLTFGELGERAARLADALRAAGVRRRDRIAVVAPNCMEFFEIAGAAALAGYIVVPLNVRLAAPELRRILEEAAPRLVFCDRSCEKTLAVALAGVPEPPLILYLSATGEDATYAAMLAQGADVTPPHEVGEDDTLFIIYTSGSTSRPKGVMLSHRGQIEAARQLALSAGVRQDGTLLVAMPLFHVGAINQSFAYLWLGAGLVIHSRYDPQALLADVARWRITGLHLAPVMLRALLDAPAIDRFDLSSLNSIKYASSPMPLPTLERAIARFGPILVQYYGLTETGGLAAALLQHEHALDADGRAPARLRSGGKPHPLCDIRIELDSGAEAATGERGEIMVRTPSAMQGYWNNHGATLAALREGWVATGDIGYLDRESYLYVVDRKKDMIVSGGENISSREVEEALLAHAAVAEAAVIGVPDARWGEAVKAFVVLHHGVARPSAAELVDHCRNQIAGYKKPQSVEFTDALPRASGTGKVDKRALRGPYWTDETRAVS